MVKKKSKKKDFSFKDLFKTNEDSQLAWVIMGILVVLIVFLGIWFYSQSLNKFSYAGLDWQKSKEGDSVFYKSRFHVFYNANSFYNLMFRNDPRENDIPMEIDFKLWQEIIITTEEGATDCGGDGVIANANLAVFLAQALNNLKISAALTNGTQAEMYNISQADCSDAIDKTVIVLQKSDVPSIGVSPENENCYLINVGDCESILAVEKFILGMIAEVNKVKL